MVWNIFYFHPYLGTWSNLTNIFQMSWNHQLRRKNIVQQLGMLYTLAGFCSKKVSNGIKVYIYIYLVKLYRPHPKWWFSKGNPLISGKSRLVNITVYTDLLRIFSQDFWRDLSTASHNLIHGWSTYPHVKIPPMRNKACWKRPYQGNNYGLHNALS